MKTLFRASIRAVAIVAIVAFGGAIMHMHVHVQNTHPSETPLAFPSNPVGSTLSTASTVFVEGFLLIRRRCCHRNSRTRNGIFPRNSMIFGTTALNRYQQQQQQQRRSVQTTARDQQQPGSMGNIGNDCNHQQQQQQQQQQYDTNKDNGCNSYTKSHSLTVCLVPPPSCLVFSDDETQPHQFSNNNNNQPPKQNDDDDDDDEDNNNTGDDHLWNVLTNLRVELRDPGLYRWPPHVNLLYPFVRTDDDVVTTSTAAAAAAAATTTVFDRNEQGVTSDAAAQITTNPILAKLCNVAEQVEPFWVSLDLSERASSNDSSSNNNSSSSNNNNITRSGLGTFGGPNRGVLWVYPESFRIPINEDEPIVELQALLEAEFPMCSETLKDRRFLPHMTLSSKFDSEEGAIAAGATLGSISSKNGTTSTTTANPTMNAAATATGIMPPPTTRCSNKNNSRLSFWCKEFYLLERDGEHEQFKRRATFALGTANMNTVIQHHDPPVSFPGMPLVEEPWVRSELDALKARRKTNNQQRRSNRRRRSTTRKSYRARKKEKRAAAAECSSILSSSSSSSSSSPLAGSPQTTTPTTISTKPLVIRPDISQPAS